MNKNKSNKKIIIAILALGAIALELSILIIYKPTIGQQVVSSWFESKSETINKSSKEDERIKLLAPASSGSNLIQERGR